MCRSAARRQLLFLHSHLHILLADDRRALPGIGELIREERTGQAGIGAGRLQLLVAADVIRSESSC